VILRAQSQEKVTTAKGFRTAYNLAKENKSFHNFKAEVDLQELNVLTWVEFFTQLMRASTL